MPSISSDRVNYLIWRYFQEEGLALSGYALDKETSASQGGAEPPKDIARGELVKLLLKGIQMQDIESEAGATNNIHEVTKDGDIVMSQNGEPDSQKPPTDTQDTSNSKPDADTRSGVQIMGQLSAADWKHLKGGVDATMSAPQTLVVAGLESTYAYIYPQNQLITQELEAQDTPTCVESLGLGVVAPDHCVLVGYGSGCIRQWQFSQDSAVLQSVLNQPRGDAGPVLFIRSSPHGTRAAAADIKTGSVVIWDLGSRSVVCQIHDESSTAVSDLVWIGGDTTVGIAYTSGVAIYRLPDLQGNSSSTPTSGSAGFISPLQGGVVMANQPVTWLRGHSKPVSLLAFEEVTQLLASGGDDGRVCVWNSQNTEPVHQFAVGSIALPVSHVSWLGFHLLTGSTDGSVKLWDVRSQPLAQLASLDVGEPVYSLRVSKHMPTQIAVITLTGVKIYTLDLRPPQFKYVGEVRANGVQSVAWGPDPCLAVTSREETVVLKCQI